MKLTNCNDSEKVECGCIPGFDYYETDTVSVLAVGSLTSSFCTFDEYVIDWYRNGEYYLTSGVGSHPDITAYHPFTGSAAIPVEAGTYVPVIRYIVSGSDQIFSSPRSCQKWCSDLANLPVIIVINAITCSTVGGGAQATYNYRLAYITTQDYRLAGRKIRFDLPEDGSAKHFAVYFYAYQVADKLEIFYNDEGNLLTSWTVGQRYNTYKCDALPYSTATSYAYIVVDLPTYTEGDFLIIKITPSVLESNINTQWLIDLKCLYSSATFESECDSFTEAQRALNEHWTLTENTGSCRWELKGTVAEATNYSSNSYMYSYKNMWFTSWNQVIYTINAANVGLYFRYGKSVNTYTASPYYGVQCTQAAGLLYSSKSGSIVNYAFTEDVDYNAYKTSYQALMTGSFMSNYSTDKTNLNHYRWLYLCDYKADTVCGDNMTSIYLMMHISSPVVFDDTAKTMKITMVSTTDEYPCDASPCDTRCNTLDQYISAIDYYIKYSTITSGSSAVRVQYPFFGYYHTSLDLLDTDISAGVAVFMTNYPDSPCLPEEGYLASYCYYYWFIYYIRGVITDINDPSGNFRVYNSLDPVTHYMTYPGTLIYEEVDHVQVFPVSPSPSPTPTPTPTPSV